MITRREFLAGMAAMAAKSGYEPKLMLQPYVWTQQFRADKIALGDGLEKLFSASQRAGYKRITLFAQIALILALTRLPAIAEFEFAGYTYWVNGIPLTVSRTHS